MADSFKFTDASTFDWVTGFLKSTVESIPETFGVTPSTETLQFRQDHPVSGLASEFAGMAVPYGGWYYGASKIPRLVKAIDTVGDVVAKPISTGFKREVLRLAPFEAARVGTSQLIGDNTLNEEIATSVMNLALTGGIGGLLKGVAAAGTREPGLPTIFPGIDIAAPAALQARHMKGLIDSGKINPEMLPTALRELKLVTKEARREELVKSAKYVGPLQDDTAGHPPLKGLDQLLNRWFRPTQDVNKKSLQVRAFASGVDKNFPENSWIDEADFAGIGGPKVPDPADPNVFHHADPPWPYGQYFRSISFNPAKPGNMPQIVENKITGGFESVGGNWFLNREAEDGMFILAKKYAGEVGKAAPTDRWLLFKTDQPGRFLPENQRWSEAMVAMHKWLPEQALDQDYGLAGNVLKGFIKEVPFRNYQTIANSRIMNKVIEKFGPLGDNEIAVRMREAFREYLTPRAYQFAKTPRANYIAQASKLTYDYADNIVNELMNGTVRLDPGKQVFFAHLNNLTGALGLPPIRTTAKQLTQEEFADAFENFIRKGVPIEEAEKAWASGDLSKNSLDFLKALQAADDVTTQNVSKVEKATGHKETGWLKGHYGWSHVWEGDTRIPLLNEKGQLAFLAGGPNKKAAQAMAREVLAEHPNWRLGDAYSKSQLMESKLEKLGGTRPVEEHIAAAVLAPSFTLERAGVGGYKWYNKTPTIDEFLGDYEKNLISRWRYQANLTVNDALTPHLDRLKRENPAAFKQVIDRMNADAGIQGKFGRMVNKASDAVLAPIIGNESATRIVNITNTTLMNFQLGAMNLAFPAMNLATFIQTTLPEMAMVMGALPERLAPYYSHFLAGGTRAPVGGMAVLQPLRLAGKAIAEMRSPSPDVTDALSWAMNNRTLDPRLVEGYIGEASAKVKDVIKLAKGDIKPGDFSFGSWLRATSEWLPANSERMARTHTFIMGYMAARDLLRGPGGQVLSEAARRNFAKQFTEKTMYLYNSADKPKILTSPVGSGLGLFKNWMFNYMAMMGQYTQEAFLKRHFAPLVWQTAGTFALGGLASTPAYWIADVFAKAFTGNDAMVTAYDMLGEEGGDGIMYGLPAMLTGVSFYSQVQAPGANPSRDAASLFDAVIFDRMRAMQTAIGGAMDHWQATGNHPGHDATVRLQMARAFLPSTIYRQMAAADGKVYSPTTGYPLVKDLSLYETMLYGMKLNPVDVDKAMVVSNKLYAQREERRQAVMQLGEAFVNAQIKGDGAEMALIMRQALVWGIDGSSVIKSAMARMAKHQEDAITRGYKPSDIAVYRNVLED